MSKKLLSLALAVVMLVSMFAFTVSAAGEVADGYKIGFYVESNAYVGMPAGEEVIFKFYYSVPDDLDLETYRHNYGNVAVAYTDAYKINSTKTINAAEARTWGTSYADFFATSSKVTANQSTKVLACITTNETEYTFSKGIYVQQVAEGGTYFTSTGYTIDPECEVFSLSFTTQDTLTASDVICVPQDTYGDDKYTQFRYLNTDTLEVITYDAADVDFSNNIAVPTAKPEVTHEKTMGQMADWTDATATTFNAGFVGKIANLDVKFDANNDECTTIESIVVEITRGETTLTGKAYQIYAQADGSYLFRAVVRNASISDDAAISYKYIVTLSTDGDGDGVKDTLTYESTEDTSFKAIYTTAKGNYVAANA